MIIDDDASSMVLDGGVTKSGVRTAVNQAARSKLLVENRSPQFHL